METTGLKGDGQVAGGNVKEAVGSLTGDESLKASGVSDQLTGQANQAIGKAKAFAKDRPWATAALLGTLGIALINTLRGKK